MEMISPSFWSFDGLRLESGPGTASLQIIYTSHTGNASFSTQVLSAKKGSFVSRFYQLTRPLRLGATQLMECCTKATFIRRGAFLDVAFPLGNSARPSSCQAVPMDKVCPSSTRQGFENRTSLFLKLTLVWSATTASI